jgi:squalene-hopene/tetraprenyl-beta-curcumene cyclase
MGSPSSSGARERIASSRALSDSVFRARRFLLSAAEDDFAELCHEMVFPRFAGFTGASEEQSSDVFARAELSSVLLDIATLEAPDTECAATWRSLARKGADYVAQAKLTDRAGGWSYFPGLPELPPDLDSLAVALYLFTRIAPEHADLCQEPIRLALANQRADGSLETWIVAPSDGPQQRQAMERGIRDYWGTGSDADVLARFAHALSCFDGLRFRDVVARIIPLVLGRQHPDGHWDVSWYYHPYYGTALCLRVLRKYQGAEHAVRRAVQFLRSSQNPDGCWGRGQMSPMDTALALWALHCAGETPTNGRGAVDGLIEMQATEGFWTGAPWIQMGIGRASGKATRVATYGSTILTTAYCLRSMLRAC